VPPFLLYFLALNDCLGARDTNTPLTHIHTPECGLWGGREQSLFQSDMPRGPCTTHTHFYTHNSHLHIHSYTHTYFCTNSYLHTLAYSPSHMHTCTQLHTHTHSCTHPHLLSLTHTHTHTHTHKHTEQGLVTDDLIISAEQLEPCPFLTGRGRGGV
jgi:hypothetical protein